MSGDNPDKFCNPLVEVEQCAVGLRKWVKERNKPKTKKNYNGNTYCNGLCVRFKSSKPGGDPYETHAYCRKCGGVWMEKKILKKSRCPCCNFLAANKSRKSNAIGSKKKVYI
jgi:ribosomal protein L37E